MGLSNRKRDFTQATLQDIRNNLKGNPEAYTDISKYWNENKQIFDLVDINDDIKAIETHMSTVRYYIHDAMPKALNAIEADIRELDASFSRQCDETTAELARYREDISDLIASIRNPNFVNDFNADELRNVILMRRVGVYCGGV